MAHEFRLPDIGEGIAEGEITKILVKPGDFVKEDQAVLEVMTDKVTAEIPSPVSGTVTEIRVREGEVVQVGSVIMVFEKAAAGSKAPVRYPARRPRQRHRRPARICAAGPRTAAVRRQYPA